MLADDCILYRIIHPSCIQDGAVSSQAFSATAERPLSVFDGGMISAKDAMERFIADGHQACGVLGITAGEAKAVGLEILEDRVPYGEHISLVFPECSRKEAKEISRRLRDMAEKRGWQCIADDFPMRSVQCRRWPRGLGGFLCERLSMRDGFEIA